MALLIELSRPKKFVSTIPTKLFLRSTTHVATLLLGFLFASSFDRDNDYLSEFHILLPFLILFLPPWLSQVHPQGPCKVPVFTCKRGMYRITFFVCILSVTT